MSRQRSKRRRTKNKHGRGFRRPLSAFEVSKLVKRASDDLAKTKLQREQELTQLGFIVGEESELLIFRLLNQLRQDVLLSFEVTEVVRTEPGFPAIDIWVCTPLGKIAVQVKTGYWGSIWFRRKNPEIFCISVSDRGDEVLSEVLRVGLEEEYLKIAANRACID